MPLVAETQDGATAAMPTMADPLDIKALRFITLQVMAKLENAQTPRP